MPFSNSVSSVNWFPPIALSYQIISPPLAVSASKNAIVALSSKQKKGLVSVLITGDVICTVIGFRSLSQLDAVCRLETK